MSQSDVIGFLILYQLLLYKWIQITTPIQFISRFEAYLVYNFVGYGIVFNLDKKFIDGIKCISHRPI